MANEFKVKNGLIVVGDVTTSGTITINGALAATQSWVTSQAYLTSASLSGYATQSYVTSAISALIDSAPSTLDTLNELAAALGDDANFATTITNSLASKLPLAGGTLTGALTAPKIALTTTGNDYYLSLNGLTMTSITTGETIWRNLSSFRFSDVNDWDYNSWAGLKFINSTKQIVLGVAGNVFTANSPQTGTLLLDRISTVYVNNTSQTVWHSGNLTNLNQLSNGPGYITSYTETDTLASVTGRGSSSTVDIQVNGINVGRGPGALPGYNHNISLGVNNYSPSMTQSRAHIAIGYNAFDAATSGYYSIAIGPYALDAALEPSETIAIGIDALGSATYPDSSIAIGPQSLFSDTEGYGNVAIGSRAGNAYNSSFGGYGENTFVGNFAGSNLKNARETTVIGSTALQTSGHTNQSRGNIAVGSGAGYSWNSGYYNTWIGYFTNGFLNGSYNVIIGGNLSTTAIDGAGSMSNSVVIADGAGNIKLFANSTGNVGVGTTSPSYKLDVNGNARANSVIIGTDLTYGGAYRVVAFGNNADGSNRIFAANDTSDGMYFAAATGQGFNFRPNGGTANLVVINSSGDVGIGTSSPATKLHVSKTDGSNELIATRIQNNLGYAEFGVQSNYARILANGSLLYAGSDGAQYFYYSGNAIMTIGTGNVGIGTTNPAYKLDVSGNSRTTGIHYVDTYLVTPLIYGGGPITMGNDVIIDSTSAWNNSAAMLNVGGTGDGRIQVRHIYGKASDSAAADHLWLNYQNTGKHVQVGDSGGGNNLYVSGDIYANGYFAGNLVATRAWVQSQGYLTSVSDVWVNTTGDTMTGSLAFADNADDVRLYKGINWLNLRDSWNNIHLRNNIAGYGIYSDATVHYWRPHDGSNNYMILSSTGLGIGTNSPSALLQVANSGRALAVYRIQGTNRTSFYDNTFAVNNDGGGADGFIYGSNVGGSFPFDGYGEVIIQANPRTGYSNGISFVTGTTSPTIKMRIVEGGNVGIGTSSPGQKLSVAGNIETTSGTGVKIGFNVADSFTAYGNSVAHYGISYNYSSSPLALSGYFGLGLFTNGIERLSINNAGKVSIGTTDTNSDKSDFTVYTGGSTSIALAGNLFRVGESDINWDIALRQNGTLQTYGQTLNLNTQAGNYAVNIQPNGTTVAQFYESYTYFPGLDFSISRINGVHSSNYFRGDASHLVIGTSGTLYLNYGGSTTNITGTTYVNGNLVWHAGNDGSGSGLDADLLDGIDSGSFLRSDVSDSFSGTLTMATQRAFVPSNYGHGVYGLYSAERYQHVWSMGAGYDLPADGASNGNGGSLYGLAWSYNPDYSYAGSNAQSKPGLNHQLLLMMNGITYTAIGNGIWTSGTITTVNHGNSSQWNTAYGWGNHASQGYLTSLPSHTHDDRYYTESESDARFLQGTTSASTPGNFNLSIGYNGSYSYIQSHSGQPLYINPVGNAVNVGTNITVSGTVTATGGNSTEWNTAYSWGNHASAGYATTSYVTTQINNLIAGAPGALDTLDELAAALGDDSNFATTVTNSIAGKVAKSGDIMTGALTIQNGPSASWDYMTLEHPGPHARINLGNAENGFLIAHEGTTTATFATNGNLTITGALIETSSIKVKENVETSEGNLDKVLNLRPVHYNKIGSQTTELGLIAEEVSEVYPEFVQYDENGDPVGVHYSRLTAALIGAVKELTDQLNEIKQKING